MVDKIERHGRPRIRSLNGWLLRNRRYIGLSFAAGMAWQLFFILGMLVGPFDYYIAEIHWLSDPVFQIPGYLFLFAMVITSFYAIRRRVGRTHWRVLHWVGVYFL